ncbi:MAG TPA: hypothetical protein VFT04_04535 [Gemmatimonadales bacterium]|nr:hypothetical protein [Gemmatimonadales bacterium]
MAARLEVGAASAATGSGGTRVSALVGEVHAWFESSELDLKAVPEAFGSAFLIPAASRGRALSFESSVSGTWMKGAGELLGFAERWWGYRAEPPAAVTRADLSIRRPNRAERTALCFSGGVDSFYSLLRRPGGVDLIVAGHGLDIPLADTARMRRFEASVRAISASLGIESAIVRTNLREHPDFSCASWERTHGGTLAAIGHLLGDAASRLVVSSSAARADAHPWGSHWQTDPLWSTGRLTVEHFGDSIRRGEKLAAMGAEPLVQKHLRVCWANRDDRLNCSRCEKCIRTEVVLAMYGMLDRFEVFEPPRTLAERIAGVPRIPVRASMIPYRRALKSGLDRDVARAVRALLIRSQRKFMTDAVVGLARRAVSASA